MAGRKHSYGSLSFHIEQNENGSLIASVVHKPHRPPKDDVGALYYVVVVIFIYGCSILMMIASYIRKNKIDQKLNRYLKEMANVRKREQQMQLFQAARKAAEVTRNSEGNTRVAMRGQDHRKFSQASDFSDIEEIMMDGEEEGGEGQHPTGRQVLIPPDINTRMAHGDICAKLPTGKVEGQRKGSVNNVRILCNEEIETGVGFTPPEQVRLKTVTVFEPKTGKSVQIWLRQGGPGRAVRGGESLEGEELLPETNLSDGEDIRYQDEESCSDGGVPSSSSPSGSFTSDCQIVTSV